MRALAAAMFFAMLPAAMAATITVHVANIDPKGGELHVALYTEQQWPDNDAKPLVDSIVPAVAPQTTVVMKDVPPGTYGIKTFQDVNKNGEFDQNVIGLPLERYGFSRDARPFLSAPGFNKAKFSVPDGPIELIIHLQ
ncbi:uncharacterized protein (DUF2141 family) [Rhizomicrobium palustre]|uniref:Uncharacterized protein (DUF2141 family) n=1 Tax=Rhizomicrobium palustre TaxID=189966 RepID=A0A846N010_9PROT|nr:DUF2141 domain-containing protein [Rhizomicrobium palustre]NIK88691.1 uncharacterized protein (DUF2141 family) [Rhizomicrobium palustre]